MQGEKKNQVKLKKQSTEVDRKRETKDGRSYVTQLDNMTGRFCHFYLQLIKQGSLEESTEDGTKLLDQESKRSRAYFQFMYQFAAQPSFLLFLILCLKQHLTDNFS